ncbi:MAG: hypothetical protein N2C14_15585, partial [Planctomycetales bacterium]
TGEPPHYGDTTLNCLFSVGVNEIVPTEKLGELTDIAMKAMETEPENRYRSVKDFADAVRDYQSHSESIKLSAAAETDLETAKESNEYDDFAQAVFGFKEASKLWSENDHAQEGEQKARMAYASSAFGKSDFDLAESLLDTTNSDHGGLIQDIRLARDERNAGEARGKFMRRVIQGGGVAFIVVLCVGLFWIWTEQRKALAAKAEAEKQTVIAQDEKKNADKQTEIAKKEKIKADKQTEIAKEEKKKADEQTEIAKKEKIKADEQTEIAKEEKKKADKQTEIAKGEKVKADKSALVAKQKAAEAKASALVAQQKQREAEIAQKRAAYQAFVAGIGSADANVERNAFGQADLILSGADKDFQHWAWKRLNYLGQLHEKEYALRDGEGKDPAPIEALTVSPGGKLLLAGLRNGSAILWNAATGDTFRELPHSAKVREASDLKDGFSPVTAVAFSPDGNRVATGANDGTIVVWELDTEAAVVTSGHRGAVYSLAFSSLANNSKWLASGSGGSRDFEAKIWDLSDNDGKLLYHFNKNGDKHFDAIRSVAFSPDNKILATASADKNVILWMIPADKDKKMQTVTLSDPELKGNTHKGAVYDVAFSADGKWIATGGYDKLTRLWSADSRDGNWLIPTGSNQDKFASPIRRYVLAGHAGQVRSTAFHKEQFLVTGSMDNTAKVWKLGSKSGPRLVKTLRGHARPVASAVFDPHDPNRVFTGSHDGFAKVWNVPKYHEQFRLDGHGGQEVLFAAFNRSGDRVVTSGLDRTARVWNTHTGVLEQTLQEGHTDRVMAVDFAPDGVHGLATSQDGSVRVWNLRTGDEIAVLKGHHRAFRGEDGEIKRPVVVPAAAFSPNGKWIVTAGDDRAVKLW